MIFKKFYFPAQHFWTVWFSEIMIHYTRKNNYRISSNDKILDVGCGLGYNCFSLREFDPEKIYGFDISKETIALLNEFPSEIKFDTIDICTDNIDPYKGSFTLITSSDVYEHVDQPQIMIDRIYTLLSDGGCACITFPNFDNHGHNQFYDINVMYTQLKQAGFKDYNVELVKAPGLLYKVFMKFYQLMQDLTDKMMKIDRNKDTRMPESDEFHEMYAYKKIQKIKDKTVLLRFININYYLIKKLARVFGIYKASKDFSNIRDTRLVVFMKK